MLLGWDNKRQPANSIELKTIARYRFLRSLVIWPGDPPLLPLETRKIALENFLSRASRDNYLGSISSSYNNTTTMDNVIITRILVKYIIWKIHIRVIEMHNLVETCQIVKKKKRIR